MEQRELHTNKINLTIFSIRLDLILYKEYYCLSYLRDLNKQYLNLNPNSR